MPLILTPAQLTRRSEFYHQLAQLTSAGLGLPRILEQFRRHPPARSFRRPIQSLLNHLQDGYPFAESLQLTGDWVPAFDIALIQAGEQSGRLPECFQQISDQYRDRASLLRTTLLVVAYPLFVLHVAIFLFPINRFTGLILHGEVTAFLLQKLLVLGPLYGIVALGVLGGQGKAAGWRAFVERLLHPVPVLGRARRALAIARFSSALEALINAGVNIVEALELAAAASASPALRRVVRVMKPELAAGMTPGEMIGARNEFPEVFAQMYQTGEISGKLDESLHRARAYYQEEGSRKLKQFILGCTAVLIFTIVVLVAWQIISFYLGYFKGIQNLGNF